MPFTIPYEVILFFYDFQIVLLRAAIQIPIPKGGKKNYRFRFRLQLTNNLTKPIQILIPNEKKKKLIFLKYLKIFQKFFKLKNISETFLKLKNISETFLKHLKIFQKFF